MEKNELRKQVLEIRKELTDAKRKEYDEKILAHLESLPEFRGARRVMAYFSVKGEAGTHGILHQWMGKKEFFLPRLINGAEFIALPLTSFEELLPNSVGIPEPPLQAAPGTVADFDLILVPGVVFDRSGNRIGMGKGYYDRFLNRNRNIPRIALAYAEQVLDRIPHKPYDEPVDMIVTQSGIIRCQKS